MTDARTALAQAAERFTFSPTARLDAELLLAHALGIERNALLLDLTRPVPDSFWPLVERRARQEPVAYITGTRGFWTLDLMVGPGALVPRVDSETLVDAALRHFRGRAPATLLDLGTGPGTLLLALLDEWRDTKGLGVDRSPQALRYAVANAAACGLADRARFVCGDWATGLAGPFDCIVTNPPYIGTAEPLSPEVRDYEPGTALFAGPDGLDDYRLLAPELRRLLAPGGAAVVEIGHEQAGAVTALLADQGFAVTLHRDLGGRPRALLAH
ncbi:peptide chain release factor N(5)-glutamine methyltransferase [Sphingomonas sp. gentR]|uniref:peptide chain release factor N(5)-glutamine methyltransferase n=1 Tax=unclassified Sphingomonas TaxID=196159 RepID=UPI000972E9B9|nr:peptide chain release factor N(5)-glutamine methyltransferase [Sphingomonas sp. LK11]APX64987.1 protein-(glutamine-N5) methyltransferase, release factor-specific [Sphingomonas sp. LK11]